MKKLDQLSSDMKDESAQIKIKYAKSKRQLRRNWSINQAKRLIEADPNSTGKHVNVLWKIGTHSATSRPQVWRSEPPLLHWSRPSYASEHILWRVGTSSAVSEPHLWRVGT